MAKIIDFHTHPFLDDDSNICNHKDIIPMKKEGIRATFAGLGVEMICGSVIVRDPNRSQWENIKAGNDGALELREFLTIPQPYGCINCLREDGGVLTVETVGLVPKPI